MPLLSFEERAFYRTPQDTGQVGTQPISHEGYEKLIAYLEKKNPPAVLPIQIAYCAGLRIGEVCGLTWQDINLEEQYLTVKRSVRYNGAKHKTIIGPTKRKKYGLWILGIPLPPF